MQIIQSLFPKTIFVMANSKFFFGPEEKPESLYKIIYTFEFEEIAKIYLTTIGAIGFDFNDCGEFASIDILRTKGSGIVPEEVMKNEDDINALQEKRVLFINFTVAALFGRINAQRHTSLTGAIYNGQDKLTGFKFVGDKILFQETKDFNELLAAKINSIHKKEHTSYLIREDEIENAVAYTKNLWKRQYNFEYADLVSCLVMNFQAAILHNQQHAAASFALNFSVIESLVKELFFSYGVVGNRQAKPYATKKHKTKKISKTAFLKKNFYDLTEILREGDLLESYLYRRIEDARKKRNNLMHKGGKIGPRESGDCQTIVRDLWALLIEVPFELNAGWSYRR